MVELMPTCQRSVFHHNHHHWTGIVCLLPILLSWAFVNSIIFALDRTKLLHNIEIILYKFIGKNSMKNSHCDWLLTYSFHALYLSLFLSFHLRKCVFSSLSLSLPLIFVNHYFGCNGLATSIMWLTNELGHSVLCLIAFYCAFSQPMRLT